MRAIHDEASQIVPRVYKQQARNKQLMKLTRSDAIGEDWQMKGVSSVGVSCCASSRKPLLGRF